jgi:hypothetical protein
MSVIRMVTLEDFIGVARNQVAAEIGGEVVILNVASGEYFGLNSVGARIWSLIETPRRAVEIRDQLLLEYDDVDAEQCTEDLLSLLRDLHSAGLIEVGDAAPG